MHISKLFQIFKDNPSLDIISTSSSPMKIRELITEGILATDISSHFQNLAILKNKFPPLLKQPIKKGHESRVVFP